MIAIASCLRRQDRLGAQLRRPRDDQDQREGGPIQWHHPRSTGTHGPWGTWVPRTVAIVGGVGFIALGVWAMVGPRSFFAALATFEPYNQHFLQDVGAFQIGLGVVLLLAAVPVRADGLTVALVGVGVGAALHTLSHVVGRDLGGTPERDIPALCRDVSPSSGSRCVPLETHGRLGPLTSLSRGRTIQGRARRMGLVKSWAVRKER